MKRIFEYLFYGFYVVWKNCFYGISSETDESEIFFNSISASIILLLYVIFYGVVFFVFLEKINYISTSREKTLFVVLFISSVFLFLAYALLFFKRKRYLKIIEVFKKERKCQTFSLILCVLFFMIPIVVMLLTPLQS